MMQLRNSCTWYWDIYLDYDFMANDPQVKHIFQDGENNPGLSWEKMLQIALRVARAIEYLQQGVVTF